MASRELFSSKAGFVMAAAGSAIGLGNIWGFPTQTASHGGAAFVVVYLILALVMAYPALMAELIIGRHARSNMVSALRGIAGGKFSSLLATFTGFAGVLTASLILSFYAIVAGWMLAFMLEAIASLLAWQGVAQWLVSFGLPRNLLFMALFMALTMAVVAKGVAAGIERWSTRLMPLLFVIMLGLIAYVLTQPGAGKGLRLYLLPDFSLLSPSLIVNAMGQAFFSLSLGVGTMLIYGSYLSEKENLPVMGVTVTLVDTGVAVFAGLLIIPAVFVAKELGVDIFTASGELVAGPDLIFQVLPVLFESMGKVGMIVALAFFVLLSIASLTSSISMLEVPVSLVVEETTVNRRQATLIMGGVIGLLSGLIIVNFDALFGAVITVSTVYSQPLLGVLLCVFVGWVWQRNNLLTELKKGHPEIEGGWFWRIWPAYVKFVCPLLILVAFVQSIF